MTQVIHEISYQLLISYSHDTALMARDSAACTLARARQTFDLKIFAWVIESIIEAR